MLLVNFVMRGDGSFVSWVLGRVLGGPVGIEDALPEERRTTQIRGQGHVLLPVVVLNHTIFGYSWMTCHQLVSSESPCTQSALAFPYEAESRQDIDEHFGGVVLLQYPKLAGGIIKRVLVVLGW